ncbi:MAG: DNA cytosine methyltransferase [Deltaproteobacteria bacterium]|nr:DNA cytosine methyltransferase [Deltaproteobacteria bacterium]
MPFIRVYDFFSGCGGTSIGFRQAGIKHAFAIDSCPDAINTFQNNFPGASVITEPIETIDHRTIEDYYSVEAEVKLFCGCAPCQPFTKQKTNTKKKISEDNRRDLLPYFSAIVHDSMPELVFIENVPGLQKVSVKDEGPFSSFIDQLEQAGYFFDYGIIAAQDYGAPQVRRRLVLVASRLGTISLPAATHGPGCAKAYVTVRDAIADLPPIEHGTEHPDKRRYPNHRAAQLSSLNLERIRHTGVNGRRDWPESLLPECYTKTTDGKRYNGHSDCYTRLAWDEPAPGLTTRCISYSNGKFGHPEQDRAITVREAARLQGFPDTFVFTGSLNAMARQIGNAVPVQVAKAFGRHFIKHVRSVGGHNG